MSNQENTPDSHKIRGSLSKIKNIFKTPQGKEFGTYMLFLLLSASIWLILSINDNRETSVQIPIELVDVPKDVVILQDMPPYIEARIRDKGPVILSYEINGLDKIEIDFEEYKKQKDVVVVGPNSLIEHVRKQMRTTTSILSFGPDSIRVSFTQAPGKRVPIRFAGEITPSPHSTLSDSIYITPDSVTLYAQPEVLASINEVTTERIVLNDLIDTTRVKAQINPIANTRIIPDSAIVVAPIEEYVPKTIAVPVAIGGVPARYSIITFPSHINVSCLVPKSKYNTIVSDDFLVGNTFTEMEKTHGTYGHIRVVNAPDYAHNVTLSQDSVEYIINEQQIKITTDTIEQ